MKQRAIQVLLLVIAICSAFPVGIMTTSGSKLLGLSEPVSKYSSTLAFFLTPIVVYCYGSYYFLDRHYIEKRCHNKSPSFTTTSTLTACFIIGATAAQSFARSVPHMLIATLIPMAIGYAISIDLERRLQNIEEAESGRR